MASMSDQQFLIQRETTPGTPATSDMRAYLGLRVSPGYEVEGDSFRASGYRAPTSYNVTEEYGTHSVEAPHCFNALLPVAAGVLGAPETEALGEDSGAYEHVMTLMARGAREAVTFTGIWGSSQRALELAYFTFNNLTYGVQRGELTLDTAGVSRTPNDEDVSFPSDFEEIPAVPIPTRAYDVYFDDSWEDLGTTQMLSTYDAQISVGDTWGRDTPINSAIVSFESLVEEEEVDYTGSMQVGFNANATDQFEAFRSGAVKYVRIAAEGPQISGQHRYRVQLDFPITIINPGEVETAPNSPTAVIPFEFELRPDTETGNLIQLTLVNTVPSL